MLKYFLYNLLNTLAAIVCYITNPIVVLFCDDAGELHGFLRYWQTWDDSCNPRCVTEKMVPKFMCYDYDKHYIEYIDTTPELQAVGRMRYFAKCINNDFTLKERIQRYLCRVYWLTRNCSYGFAFWLFGLLIQPNTLQLIGHKTDDLGEMIYIRDTNKNKWLDATFKYKNNCRINSWLRWEVFLGWKTDDDATTPTQAMIANRFTIRFGNY